MSAPAAEFGEWSGLNRSALDVDIAIKPGADFGSPFLDLESGLRVPFPAWGGAGVAFGRGSGAAIARPDGSVERVNPIGCRDTGIAPFEW